MKTSMEQFYAYNRKQKRVMRELKRNMEAFSAAAKAFRWAQWQAYWTKTAALEKREDGNG